MTIESTVCVTPRCDRCHVPALDPAGTAHHWPTEAAALTDLSGPVWGWLAAPGTPDLLGLPGRADLPGPGPRLGTLAGPAPGMRPRRRGPADPPLHPMRP